MSLRRLQFCTLSIHPSDFGAKPDSGSTGWSDGLLSVTCQHQVPAAVSTSVLHELFDYSVAFGLTS